MFKVILKKYFLLILLVIVNLIIGLLILPGFGESVDERSQIEYSERTIQAAGSIFTQGVPPISFIQEKPEQGSHGPAFMVVVTVLRQVFLGGRGGIEQLTFYHLFYFLTFLVGIVSMYFLALRWVGPTAALGAALLFNTQPILFGQAFMNPKDVIFMSLMTASAAVGFWMVDRDGKPSSLPGKRPLYDNVLSVLNEFLRADVWLAGLLLGFASAMRIVAPLVGLVIFAYLLISHKWQVLPRLLAYGLIAFTFMVVIWPYLWPDPVGRLLESVMSSTNYPGQHLALFKGVVFDAQNIPKTYVPVLLTLQLTETTLLLVGVGVLSFLKKMRWDLVALVGIWFVFPAAAAILGKVHLYNNLRQVFFILPPLFILTGLGLDWLFTVIRRPGFRYLIILLVLLPGLYANVTLYPYQYVYYNEFVGGVSGAYRKFDLDYWNLAFKEAQGYVNQVAGKDANIYVDKSKNIVQVFARPDLIFNAFGARDVDKYDFIIVSTAKNLDMRFAKFPTVYVVERDGVPLAFVKKP